jgi:hypothetical protein
MARQSFLDRARAASARMLQRISDAVRPATLPPSPFESWQYEQANDAITDALDAQTIDVSASTKPQNASGDMAYGNPRAAQDPIEINRAFYDGDHWQNGAGWIGPHPAQTDDGAQDLMDEIALHFTSKNVVREVVDRHTLGVVGRAWQWGWTVRRDLKNTEKPTTAEQALIDEATALTRAWIKARKVPSMVRNAVVTLLLAERASTRLQIPAGLSVQAEDGSTRVTAASIEEALGKIYVEHDKPEVSAVVNDPDTRLECGVWLFEQELDAGEGDDTQPDVVEFAGLTFLDETGQTVIRITPKEADAEKGAEEVEGVLDLGGRIPMHEMRRSALVSTQVQQQQRALNLAETMIPRNSVTAGFLERTILDGQAPAVKELDDEGNWTGRWIQKPFFVGAGVTNFIAAVEHEAEDGKVTVGSPSMVYRDPIKPDGVIAASDKHYKAILDEVAQLHVIMNGDSDPSGKSRIEARAEYVKSLLLTQPEAESLISFVIETSMAMAETIAGKTGRYTSQLRAQATCRLDIGPLSADERTAIEKSIGVTISRETAMLLLGVEDVDAEIARINADPLARFAMGKAAGDALQSLTLAGATLDGAAAYIGIEGKQLDALLTPSEFDVVPTQPNPGGARTPPPTDPAAQSGTPNNGNGSTGPSNQKGRQTGNGASNGRGAPARSTSSSGSKAGGQ